MVINEVSGLKIMDMYHFPKRSFISVAFWYATKCICGNEGCQGNCAMNCHQFILGPNLETHFRPDEDNYIVYTYKLLCSFCKGLEYYMYIY